MKFPIGFILDIEICTASRDFFATARLLFSDLTCLRLISDASADSDDDDAMMIDLKHIGLPALQIIE